VTGNTKQSHISVKKALSPQKFFIVSRFLKSILSAGSAKASPFFASEKNAPK